MQKKSELINILNGKKRLFMWATTAIRVIALNSTDTFSQKEKDFLSNLLIERTCAIELWWKERKINFLTHIEFILRKSDFISKNVLQAHEVEWRDFRTLKILCEAVSVSNFIRLKSRIFLSILFPCTLLWTFYEIFSKNYVTSFQNNFPYKKSNNKKKKGHKATLYMSV